MGIVYRTQQSVVQDYPDGTLLISDALVEPGKKEVNVKVAQMSRNEVNTLLLKLDALANSYQNEGIAVMVAEAVPAILTAARMVKDESKQEFTGILGIGAELDVVWLRPEDVGGSILRGTASAGSLGLYGGTGGAVYSWLQTFTAGTSDDIIPAQTMKEEAAVVHLGAIDTVAVPKIDRIKFTISGVSTPVQSTPFNITDGSDLPFVKFEKPIIVGPEKKQKVEVDPYLSGDSKFELLSLLIAKAEDLTF